MNAVILCNKRTGSTFLQEAMDSHPAIKAFDEMFMVYDKETERRGHKLYRTMRNDYTITEYLDWLYLQTDKPNTVFRLIYEHNDYWTVMPHIRQSPIIHLLRDPVDVTVSHFCKLSKPDERVYADPKMFKLMLGLERNIQNNYRKAIKHHNKVLEIRYEDVIGHREGERENISNVGMLNIRSDQVTYLKEGINKKICDFMEVDNIPMHSNVTKKFVLPRDEKIINWNSICQELL
jgi:hypothetical protein